MNSAEEEKLSEIGRAVAENSCVLFLGAGASAAAETRDGKCAPGTGQELAERIASRFGLSEKVGLGLARVCMYVDSRFSRPTLAKYLHEELIELEPPEGLQLLPLVHWQAIYTINFDVLVEDAYELKAEGAVQCCRPIYSSEDIVAHVGDDECCLYKLHGCITRGALPHTPLVLTDKDLRKSHHHRKLMFGRLAQHRAQCTIVFVGFSMSDYDIMRLLEDLHEELALDYMPRSYCVGPDFDDADRDLLASNKVSVVNMTAEDFFHALFDVVNSQEQDTLRSTVSGEEPTGALARAIGDLAPVARDSIISFFSSPSNVEFEVEPNTYEFYRGSPANWGVFRERHDVKRTLTNDILDQLLHLYWEPTDLPAALILLGEAGAGKSTIIRRCAFELCNELDAHVLMSNDVCNLDAAAIEALAASLPAPLLVVVDNITPSVRQLASLMRTGTENSVPIVILGGARTNEWNDATAEMAIPNLTEESLSDLDAREVEELVQLLEETGNLGVLEPLSFRDRCRAIEERSERQLLVALREATEGRPFEEIVADEVHGIPDDVARMAYLRVSAAHALDCPLRIGVVQKLTNVPYRDFGRRLLRPAENVMLLREPLIPGVYHSETLSTRHARVAEMVLWGFLQTASQRQALYGELIGLTDPGRPEDAELLWKISNHRLLDQLIDDYSLRLELFDDLIKKLPNDAYVRQHLARHHLKNDEPQAAREAIEEAIQLIGEEPVLLDTKARVLMRLGSDESRAKLRDVYYQQARELFGSCMAQQPTNSYAYHGLATLLSEEADRAGSRVERAGKIAEAIDMLEEGIGKVINRGMLYYKLGRVESAFGSTDKARSAFEEARRENPGDARSAYMLGRIEKQARNFPRAADLFAECLALDQRHARAAYFCANCRLAADPDNESGIVSMYRTALQLGYAPAYEAQWRLGAYLFEREHLANAKAIFDEIDLRPLPNTEIYERRGTLKEDNGTPKRFWGHIKHIKQRSAWIVMDVFGEDLYAAPRSLPKDAGPGSRVEFAVYFNLRGPVAWDISCS